MTTPDPYTELHIQGRYLIEIRLDRNKPLLALEIPHFSYTNPCWRVVGVLALSRDGQLSHQLPQQGDRDYDLVCKQNDLYHANPHVCLEGLS